MTRKETVKLIDGTEKEIEIGFLSFETKNKIFQEFIDFGAKGQELEVKKIDIFGMKNSILKNTVRGCELSQICDDEGERIFSKYFQKVIEGIGGNSGN